MALRVFRRTKPAPGLSLNLSKRGGSLSFGPIGMKYTVGRSGTQRTAGVPGTDLYYTKHSRHSTRRGRARSRTAKPAPGPARPGPARPTGLIWAFFKRLFTPEAEKHFVDGIDNHSQLEAAILYWKGRALRRVNLLTAARDALTAALRHKKDRDPELLRAIQHERALVYDALGRRSRAREEFGRIYADEPDFQDVAERIG